MDRTESRQLIRDTILEMTDSVPGVIPQMLADAIKEKVQSQLVWHHDIPVLGSFYIGMNYTIVPNGTIRIEMTGPDGSRLWNAILRPPQ